MQYFPALMVMETGSVFFIAHLETLTINNVCVIVTAKNTSLTHQQSEDTAVTKGAGAETREAIR